MMPLMYLLRVKKLCRNICSFTCDLSDLFDSKKKGFASMQINGSHIFDYSMKICLNRGQVSQQSLFCVAQSFTTGPFEKKAVPIQSSCLSDLLRVTQCSGQESVDLSHKKGNNCDLTFQISNSYLSVNKVKKQVLIILGAC